MKTVIVLMIVMFIGASTGYSQQCDPPGEIVGVTEYPWQALGSSSQRIAHGSADRIHITWTKGSMGLRRVYYNFRGEDSTWSFPGGVEVSQYSGSGFGAIALLLEGEAAVAYHNLSNSNYTMLGIDAYPGFGIFNEFDIPDLLPGGSHGIYPQVAISVNGDIHVLMTEQVAFNNEYRYLAYIRSEDGGTTWLDPVVIDSVALDAPTITASPDGKVAIVYLKPTDYSSYSVVKNDVCYFESVDGRTWDFRFPTNITDYLNDNENIFCPWGQDAVYDNFGDLNVVWAINNIAMDGGFIDDAAGLCYYSSFDGIIMQIADMPDTLLDCDPGPMNSAISMPSISAEGNGILTVVYTGFSDNDVSGAGYCVGDLYLVNGISRWHHWIPPVNITETHTPNCLGDCESEEFPSLSEDMPGFVTHLTYVMRNLGDNPDTVYYLPIEIDIILGVDERQINPTEFSLLRAYPNPFNARTTIEFALGAPADVELIIYDITGAKVETIRRQGLDAGKHSIVWDAKEAASGVYFARMQAGGFSKSIKMVLLK